jgi:hypothetical protein
MRRREAVGLIPAVASAAPLRRQSGYHSGPGGIP